MKKKSALLLITSVLALCATASVAVVANSNGFISQLIADVEPYTLTIDSSNKSNFVQDGDIYRGTFKTALGNDITFKTNKNVSSEEGVLFKIRDTDAYLINETPLRGVTKIEVTGHYKSDSGSYYTVPQILYVYYLADPDQIELDEYVSNYRRAIYFDQNNDFYTYSENTDVQSQGSSYYLFKPEDTIYSSASYTISKIKFYFSCESSKSYLYARSSNFTYGQVKYDSRTENEFSQFIYNGYEVTLEAVLKDVDEDAGLYPVFKGWYYYGTETLYSNNLSITFTPNSTGNYKFEARFAGQDQESFTLAEKHTIGEVVPTDDMYSSYLTASRGGLEYCLKADIYGLGGYKTQQAFAEGNVFQLEFESGYGGSDRRKQELTLSGFDPNYVSCVELIVDMSNSSYTDQMVKYSGSGTFTSYQHENDYTKIVWSGMTSDTAVLHPTNDLYTSNAGLSFIVKQVNVIYK